MNDHEKEVMKTTLSEEKKYLKWLEQVYKKAGQDVAQSLIKLELRKGLEPENLQSIIYQQKYQNMILEQIKDTLKDLHENEYSGISEYLDKCYENGYIGTMYSLHNQDIPLVVPIDTRKVVHAIQNDTKLNGGLYKALGENVDKLKLSIKAEVSRGIVNGSSWGQVARKIAEGMNSPFQKAMNRSMLIARTEGHRVQEQATLDAGKAGKAKGADLLKQWDATLDSKTRPWHEEADGQIVEMDEYFIVDGEEMEAPSIGGSAHNVCNCRCQLLLRPRWTLDEDELKRLQERAEFFGLDKSDSFDKFKEKYLKLPENADKIGLSAEGLTIEVYHSKKESLKKEFSDLKMKSFAMRRSNDEMAKKAHFERLKKINDELIELDKEWAKVSSSIVQNKMTETFGILKDVRNIEQTVKKVNPNFLKGSEYQNNCGYCSVTYDAIRRGFNVEAKPKKGLLVAEWKQMWKEFEPSKVQAKRKKSALDEIKKEVISWGHGSRGSIYVQWDGSTYGHFFNIENENGVVKFIDGQNGSSDCEEYFEDVKPSSIIYGRTDNLALTEKTFEAMKKGSDENE